MPRKKKISDVPDSEVVVLPSKEVKSKVKYRCDFKSYDEYTQYRGEKG